MLNRKLIVLLVFFFTGCIEEYTPPEIADHPEVLVIESFLNTNNPAGTVRLTKTANLNNPIPSAETGALVQLESESSIKYDMEELTGGYYQVNRNLYVGETYRLWVTTIEQKVYQSEWVTIKRTPDITALDWDINFEKNSLDVKVSTVDPDQNSRFYKWSLNEIWEHKARFESILKVENEQIVPRNSDESIYTCWIEKKSTNILIGTSVRLSEDRIEKFPLVTNEITHDKFGNKYYVGVDQAAINEEEYNYWEQTRKNTDQLGSLFDPLPSNLIGNIRCVSDPNTPVVGYFTLVDIKTSQLFLTRNQVEEVYGVIQREYSNCAFDSVLTADSYELTNPFFQGIVVQEWWGLSKLGYYFSTRDCADCRTGGGTTQRPSVW